MSLAPVGAPAAGTRPLAALKLPARLASKRLFAATTPQTLRARLLVIAAAASDNTLPAIRQALDDLATPYDVYIATQTPNGLTADWLANGANANYQGVILTDGSLGYQGASGWTSALSATEWNTLWQFEAAFNLRQVSWYTYPQPSYGFEWPNQVVDTSTPAPGLDVSFTTTGAALFSYANTANPVTVQQATVYLARPNATLAPEVISVEVELADANGNAAALITRYTDGRENLALTFDSNQYLFHTLQLAYGVVNWVTRGLFIGERHEVIAAQVDDVFIADEVWPATAEYRIDDTDANVVLSWLQSVQQQPSSAGLQIALAFNGVGAGPDPLTVALVNARGSFGWISHTFTHLDLDRNEDGTPTTYAQVADELVQNDITASFPLLLGGRYDVANLVTPGISGLTSADAMRAAADNGVRFVVSDTSRIAAFDNLVPNIGQPNLLQPQILEIPRRPTNLFYNVTTPTEWVGEYNQIYGAAGSIPPPAGLGFDSTYEQILDRESDTLIRYLLRGSLNPWMFHESNLRAYDGSRSLLSELLDRTLTKYRRYLQLPIASPKMEELGRRFIDRSALLAASVEMTISPGQSITVGVVGAATVPITGLSTVGSEQYGGQSIAHLSLAAGQTVTLPLQ